MFGTRLLVLTLSLILSSASVLAQDQPATKSESSQVAVTASVASNVVRVAAASQVLQIRMEVLGNGGEVVFDSGLRQGNLIDWKVADATQPMRDGSYLVVVTVRDFQAKYRQRLAVLTVEAGQLSLKQQRSADVSGAQAQALTAARQAQKVEAAEADDAMTVLREGKERAVVMASHDGQTAEITSTTGPLTLSTGDFFTRQEREQVRITPDGRVGIGTTNPEATLDVAGPIKARGGIQFEDGSVLNSAKNTTTTANSTQTINAVGGTGTTNRVAKWVDSTGTLADSQITENASGFVGIGNTNPTSKFSVTAAPTAELRFDQGSGGQTPVLSVISTQASPTVGSAAVLGAGTAGAAFVFSDNNPFYIVKDTKSNVINNNLGNGTPLFAITPAGDVGIGTLVPSTKLEVGGNLRISGAGNKLFFPDGTSMSTAAAGGGNMTGTGIVTSINDAATSGVINDNRVSPNLARLNGVNGWTGANSFAMGLSANNSPITSVGAPVNVGDAVNKGYADSTFVKFVPGAEQLSVGDANGTAPMINLRGGSTCCSGPGGHTPAWFKVFQNGSFVATGNLGIGISPMQGKGYRTSWDSYKGSFRSGYADAEWDDANVGFFSWAGGSNSTAIGLYSLAFGDTNTAESTSSIVFGSGNQVKGAAGFSAGAGNRVCDTYGVALGNNAKSGGPFINGKCDPDSFNLRGLAAIAIGYNVTADQDHTMAFGKFASNNGFAGTFVWSDGSATASVDTFRNTANNEFAARATGGFRFRTNLTGTTGCNLPAGSGVFNCTSSRYTKANFINVSGDDVLARLRAVPVSTWNYISEGKQVRHMGPMAEDFYKAFNLGVGNTSIGVQDLGGVSLAAIKALDQRTTELQQKTAEVEQLRAQVNNLQAANDSMEKRLAALEQNTGRVVQQHHRRR